jgi:hypothetical protein
VKIVFTSGYLFKKFSATSTLTICVSNMSIAAMSFD